MTLPHRSFSLVLSAVLFCSIAYALEVPPLRARINDLAHMLSTHQAEELETQLQQFEEQTTHQIMVLTIPSLHEEVLEDFSLRVSETWKIGHKGHDNGVLLLIAKDDRKIRLEIGYGLEGVLPDAIANGIIQQVIVPRFRDGDFAGGIRNGVSAVMQAARGEPVINPANETRKLPSATLSGILALFCMSTLIGSIVGLTRRSTVSGALSGGLISGLFGLAAMIAIGPEVWLLGIFVGALSGMITSLYAQRAWGRAWTVSAPRSFDFSPRDAFGMGYGGRAAGGYGSGSSSGGSSGGVSGGGGGFGGGGASGGW